MDRVFEGTGRLSGPTAARSPTRGSTSLRILHAIDPAPYGGAESVVRQLARVQARLGDRVAVAGTVTHGAATADLRTLNAAGVVVLFERLPPRSYVRELLYWRHTLRRFEPEVVHTHGYRADLLAGLCARRLGFPVVTTVHGFTGGGRRNRFYEWTQRNAHRLASGIVAVSRPLGERLQSERMRPRLYVIPNAWETPPASLTRGQARAALGLHSGAVAVGWVGRLSCEKGPDLFLRALGRIGEGVTGVIIGEGPAWRDLRTLTAELGLAGRVAWVGSLPSAYRFFPAFDVFVLSSRTEGTPMVLFEAMSAGVPIVATAVGGVPHILTSAEAILVPPKDPEALANGIRRVMEDPGASTVRAARARERLESRFAPERWVEAYRRVYFEAIRRGGAA